MDVSIIMLVYNHDRFLKQALESVLMQETDFEYELIVGEDCSPDGSRAIIQSYEEKFGGRMKPIYRDKNLGGMQNLMDCFERCTGRYIAFLEGDDYWTDPRKLQLQVEFLDSHPAYSGASHDYEYVDISGNFLRTGLSEWDKPEYSISDLKQFVIPYQTSAVMVRNQIQKLREENQQLLRKYGWIPADRTLMLLQLKSGNLGIMPERMSAYRFYMEENGTNWVSRASAEAKWNFLYQYFTKLTLERFLKDIGVPEDLLETRMRDLWKARDIMHKNPSYRVMLTFQCIIMAIIEPHKIRFTRRLISHRAEQRRKS